MLTVFCDCSGNNKYLDKCIVKDFPFVPRIGETILFGGRNTRKVIQVVYHVPQRNLKCPFEEVCKLYDVPVEPFIVIECI